MNPPCWCWKEPDRSDRGGAFAAGFAGPYASGHSANARAQGGTEIAHPDTQREAMDAAIKALVIPHLRGLGFKGSLPHFHRLRGAAVDVLSVQFRSSGGAFVVELGRVLPGGFDFHGKHIPANKAKNSYLRERHRLGAELRVNCGDHWFTFADQHPDDVAGEVCAELDRAELWAFLDGLRVLGTAT